MNFVIVGGGPTGVEMAGAIAEIARETLGQGFSAHRSIGGARDSGGRRTASARRLPGRLSASALKQLQDLGVEV